MEDQRSADDRKFHRLAKNSDRIHGFMLFMIFMIPLALAAMLTGLVVNGLFEWINADHEMGWLSMLFSLGIGIFVSILILYLVAIADSSIGAALIAFIMALFGSLMSNVVTYYAVNEDDQSYGEVLVAQLIWFGGATLAVVLIIVLAYQAQHAVKNALWRERNRRHNLRKLNNT